MLQANNNSRRSIETMHKLGRVSQAMTIGLAIVIAAISSAHSELSIQEKEPQSSVINQYAALKNADESSSELHQLIATLNQKVALNPKDSLSWELLAQIYYNNSYYAYAVYAASEAIEQGYSTTKLKKILLNSSAMVSESQLEAGYLSDEVDAEFLKDYQNALSKIYGEVHGFNYDESLPKPQAPVVKARAAKLKSKSRPQRRAAVKQKAKATPKKKVRVKQKPRPAAKVSPQKSVPKPAKRSTAQTSAGDPFKILR